MRPKAVPGAWQKLPLPERAALLTLPAESLQEYEAFKACLISLLVGLGEPTPTEIPKWVESRLADRYFPRATDEFRLSAKT